MNRTLRAYTYSNIGLWSFRMNFVVVILLFLYSVRIVCFFLSYNVPLYPFLVYPSHTYTPIHSLSVPFLSSFWRSFLSLSSYERCLLFLPSVHLSGSNCAWCFLHLFCSVRRISSFSVVLFGWCETFSFVFKNNIPIYIYKFYVYGIASWVRFWWSFRWSFVLWFPRRTFFCFCDISLIEDASVKNVFEIHWNSSFCLNFSTKSRKLNPRFLKKNEYISFFDMLLRWA